MTNFQVTPPPSLPLNVFLRRDKLNDKKRKADVGRHRRIRRPFMETHSVESSEESSTETPAKDLPEIDDTDLHRTDIDAHIKRYRGYIQKGYPKKGLEEKITALEKAKRAREQIILQYDGMDWVTIQRLETLTMIAAKLKEEGDPYKELVNVEAVIAAYKARELKLESTSYWAQGRKLGESEGFNWKEFQRLNSRENRGEGGFWVEGVFQTNELNTMPRRHVSAPSAEGHYVPRLNLSFRLDRRLFDPRMVNYPPEWRTVFLDDTGADIMSIYEDDLQVLMGDDAEFSTAPWEHLMGYARSRMADGSTAIEPLFALEVNIKGQDHTGREVYLRDDWTSCPCIVMSRNSTDVNELGAYRLAGPFLRHTFWVGSGPEKPARTYASNNRHGLSTLLPQVAQRDIPKTALFRAPHFGASWDFNQAISKWEPRPDYISRGVTPMRRLARLNNLR